MDVFLLFVCLRCGAGYWALFWANVRQSSTNQNSRTFVSSTYCLTDLNYGFFLRFVASMHWPCLENTSRVFARIYSWLHYGNALNHEFRVNFCTFVVTHFELDVVEHHLTSTKETTNLRAFGFCSGFTIDLYCCDGQKRNKKEENKKKENWLVSMLARWGGNDDKNMINVCVIFVALATRCVRTQR